MTGRWAQATTGMIGKWAKHFSLTHINWAEDFDNSASLQGEKPHPRLFTKIR